MNGHYLRFFIPGQIAVAFLGVALAISVASCGGKSERCMDSTDCARSLACRQGSCQMIDCASPDDCLDDETCAPPSYGRIDHARNTCTAACSVFFKCDGDETCSDGICTGKNMPSDTLEDAGVYDGTVAEIREDIGGDVPGDTDDDLRTDLPPVELEIDCKTCVTHADCGNGYTCLPVGADKHCLRDCNNDGDCPVGYTCYASSTQKSCLPVTYNCVACTFDSPCGNDQCCDFNTGKCKTCREVCFSCTYDFDCMAGLRCFKQTGSASGFCVEECFVGECSDTTNFKCADNGKGVEICQPKTEGCGGCVEPTPYPFEGGCIECVNNDDCDENEMCSFDQHKCIPSTCSGDTIMCESDMKCHQCCVDDDCLRFAEATGICLEDGTCDGVAPCGGLCTTDFPVCTVVQGVEQCVQCVTDADCALMNSDCTCVGDPLYSCIDETGAICQAPGVSCRATCQDSGDCPPTAAGGDMGCAMIDGGSEGFCYDPLGTCDGANACCGPGRKCYDIYAILLSAMPMPGAQMYYCDCEDNSDCINNKACTDMSIICMVYGQIGVEICPGGQLPPNMPAKMCLSLEDLTGGLI